MMSACGVELRQAADEAARHLGGLRGLVALSLTSIQTKSARLILPPKNSDLVTVS